MSHYKIQLEQEISNKKEGKMHKLNLQHLKQE